jgi:hypothetical protein
MPRRYGEIASASTEVLRQGTVLPAKFSNNGCPSAALPFVVVMSGRGKEDNMRYLLLMCSDGAADEPAQKSATDAADEPCWAPWAREMQGRGVVLHDGAQLHPATSATTVRMHEGQILLSDGPFAETKEQIVGYDVIECADLDAAIEAAARHPVASSGMVEVRPIRED